MPADATVSKDLRARQVPQEQLVPPTHFQSERFLPAALLLQPLQVILLIRLLILFCLKATREILVKPVLREWTESLLI